MRMTSYIHMPAEEAVEALRQAAVQADFGAFCAGEQAEKQPDIAAVAALTGLGKEYISQLFADSAQKSGALLTSHTIVLTASQSRALRRQAGECKELHHYFNLFMGPAFAKHGFGFLCSAAQGGFVTFATVSLPDDIASMFVYYDSDGVLLNNMMRMM